MEDDIDMAWNRIASFERGLSRPKLGRNWKALLFLRPTKKDTPSQETLSLATLIAKAKAAQAVLEQSETSESLVQDPLQQEDASKRQKLAEKTQQAWLGIMVDPLQVAPDPTEDLKAEIMDLKAKLGAQDNELADTENDILGQVQGGGSAV